MALQIEPGASGGIHTRTSIIPHAAGDVLSLICIDSAVNEYVWCFTIQHKAVPAHQHHHAGLVFLNGAATPKCLISRLVLVLATTSIKQLFLNKRQIK